MMAERADGGRETVRAGLNFSQEKKPTLVASGLSVSCRGRQGKVWDLKKTF